MITLADLHQLAQDHGLERKLLYSPSEAVKLLDRGRNLLYQQLHTGQLRSVRAGKRYQIPASALLEHLNGPTAA